MNNLNLLHRNGEIKQEEKINTAKTTLSSLKQTPLNRFSVIILMHIFL